MLGRSVKHCLKLWPDNLGRILAFRHLLLWVGLTCTPILLDRSIAFIKIVALTCVVIFVWSSMLLAQHAVFLSPMDNPLQTLFGLQGSINILCFSLVPFDLIMLGYQAWQYSQYYWGPIGGLEYSQKLYSHSNRIGYATWLDTCTTVEPQGWHY